MSAQEPSSTTSSRPGFLQTDDAWAIILGSFILCVCFAAVYQQASQEEIVSPLKKLIVKPGKWADSPLESICPTKSAPLWPGLLTVFSVIGLLMTAAAGAISRDIAAFLRAFPVIFLMALLAMVASSQLVVKQYGFSDAIWAILGGMLISNLLGTPQFLKPAMRTELYIKTGLVILGAEVLFNELMALGIPGIFVSWVVTPVVLISTFWFGQRVLKMKSPSLNMVIAADMSVCGVSAAIATAAACKAKKDELSVAIGLSMAFTAVMMVVMPLGVTYLKMDPVVAGAWIGGTIDATGAVAAAGHALGEAGEKAAVTVKMIQNILIGVISFCVAAYWVRYQEGSESGVSVGVGEIWRRFPRFVLGFLAASVLFTMVFSMMLRGDELVPAMIDGSTKTIRSWLFCLAFVSIGLESDFRTLADYFRGGKPLLLYVAGQTFNLLLTLFMAWLMFSQVFPEAANVPGK